MVRVVSAWHMRYGQKARIPAYSEGNARDLRGRSSKEKKKEAAQKAKARAKKGTVAKAVVAPGQGGQDEPAESDPMQPALSCIICGKDETSFQCQERGARACSECEASQGVCKWCWEGDEATKDQANFPETPYGPALERAICDQQGTRCSV